MAGMRAVRWLLAAGGPRALLALPCAQKPTLLAPLDALNPLQLDHHEAREQNLRLF